MEEFFFYSILITSIAARHCQSGFFLWWWSHSALLKKTRRELRAAWNGAAVALPLLGMPRGMCSNLKTRIRGSFRVALSARSATLGILLLILFAFSLGTSSTAQAATVMCSDFGGVVDGNNPADDARVQSASTFGIDMNCTVKNFPESVGGFPITNINFQFPGQQSYYIVFDDVFYYGNMSCNDPTHSDFWIYWTPGGYSDISSSCQEFMVPVDAVLKKNPPAQTTASIGIPFTYTITAPLLGKLDETGTFQYMANADDTDIKNVVIADDLTASGAALSHVSNTAYLVNTSTGVRTSLGPLDLGVSSTWLANHPGVLSDSLKHLVFSYENNSALNLIQAGYNIEIEITVVLDNTPAGVNPAGTQFANTAKMWFDKTINSTDMVDLQAHPGITPPMTIVGPDLVVTKSSTTTALNIGDTATFTIDVQNNGSGDAWNTTILDNIPVGMCVYDPTGGTGVSAQIFEADGVTLVSTLDQGANDYSVTYDATACQLGLTMESAATVIGPSQHLIITYQSQLDSGFSTDGDTLTNVAGATQWFSAESNYSDRRQYGPHTLSDGTPDRLDFQDSETVTAALSGYYFEKTVANLNTGVYPATTAAPGDTLHYNLRLFNVDQTINGITISDELDVVNTFTGPPDNVTISDGTYSFDPTGGTSKTGQLQITGVDVAQGGELVIDFDITLRSTLSDGTVVSNQASLNADQGTPISTDDFFTTSDDPYTHGVSSPYDPLDQDPTEVKIQTPGPLSKANTQENATIGEQFSYRITVPATSIAVPLYDVQILDDVSQSNADLKFVSATVISGGALSLSNTGTATNLIIENTATGIDIPADAQVVIDITVELQNTINNQDTQPPFVFANSASYTYNRVNGNNATQTTGGADATGDMTVVEPDLTATKAVSFVTPAGKLPTDPATVGDVLEYSITIPNGGNSTAFDTSVVDTLPANVSLVPDSATAQINGVAVADFAATPTTLPGGELAWGQQNGDSTLDIRSGQTLVLTYQVTVEAVTADIINSVYVDWTSLDGVSSAERTGVGCQITDALNDYCFGPATVSVTTLDNTSITKSAVGDSYAETPPSAAAPVVRVGDTVTYDLTLNLQEYATRNVVVEDDLPVGMALESFTITGGANFSYTLAAQPAAGDTGTLRWEFGDITNLPSNDGTPIDTLVIEYVARVVTDAPPVGVAYHTSILRNNLARLSYTGGDPAVYPDRLTATETIDVRQPQMSAISKIDLGTGRVGTGTLADPYQVNISTDVMNFRLSSCNDGLAPAYGVVITDQLAPELDETDLESNPPVVRIGTTTLTADNYTYTPPPIRGGEMRIVFLDSAPVNPGECITVDYNIGFHTDLTTSTTWSNQAGLPEYRSLPLSQTGRIYTSTNVAQVWMTNLVNDEQLVKTLISSAEATIGDEVVYRIKVPAAPMNRAFDNVVVTDTLVDVLEYVSATAVDGNGAAVTMTDNSVAPVNVILGIGNIPAGEQVIITLTARVANNAHANAGVSFTNTASYTYTLMDPVLDTSSSSGPVTIVEPLLAIAKTVANVTNPGAAPNDGDILRYSVTFTASGGAAGDNFSDAFDLLIEDSLSLGLVYQSDTAGVDVAGNTIVDPKVTGDGSTTAQTLTWNPADGTDIDVVEGSQVTLTYNVEVRSEVLAGQELGNSATVQWTGIDDPSNYERDGSDGIEGINDYFAGPASVTLMTELAVSMVKSVVNVTTGQDPGTNAVPGDTLRYTIVLTNQSIAPLNNASIVDELDANFAPGSLQLDADSLQLNADADTTNTDGTGGANGTGIVDIRNLTLAEQGDPGDSATIVFEARLAPVISSGTTVLNQALLTGGNLTDEPSNQTATLISSAPAFEVWKTSQDITGDPAELMAGDGLRYTITVKNIGNENAVNTLLSDRIPANTTYVAGSTTLNGVTVTDPSAGVSALQAGMLINAPENTTAGFMGADIDSAANRVATITFDVVVNASAVDGTVISNQGFVSGNGEGGEIFPQQPSDDPDTAAVGDPTIDVVGSLPYFDVQKTVAIVDANNSTPGIVDPNDVLHYTITVTNLGSRPVTNVVLTDPVPAATRYNTNSTFLNGDPVTDPGPGVSPLIAGIAISSSDLTPPLPGPGAGVLSPGESAVIEFDVTVDDAAAPGTVISNQGVVGSNELPDEPTDADGIDSNGDQPTVVIVGEAPTITITKEVFVIGGGTAAAGGELEYVVRVTNAGLVDVTNVVVTDNLDVPVPGQMTYIGNSGLLNGLPTGVGIAGSTITADYSSNYGDLAPGGIVELRFRVTLDSGLNIGDTVTNRAVVSWNASTAFAEVSIVIGGTPGSATLSGRVWHDVNLDDADDPTEAHFADWSVTLYRNNQLLATVLTDANGVYRLSGLAPNDGTPDLYELRFTAPGAGPNTASMGDAHSSDSGAAPPFTDGPQRISNIIVRSGENWQDLNLPLQPNGAVYNSVARVPITGAKLVLLNAATGAALPSKCFDDPVQQNQVTTKDGFYKFDLNFSAAACPSGGAYLIEVTPPPAGYQPMPSQIIPPTSDATTSPFSVPACPGSADDAEPATAEYCEAVSFAEVPPTSTLPRTAGTVYHLHLLLEDKTVPGQSQIYNNFIPIDPELGGAVAITKTSSLINVTRGALVPYTITVNNVFGAPLFDISIADSFPAGFKYVSDSARLDGHSVEPSINGLNLTWDNLELQVNQSHTIQLLLVVGSGVSEGEYVNRAVVINTATGDAISGQATATVEVIPDPTFDCTDAIGKVFDDHNLNGRQETGEKGLHGVRVVTARGLIAATDEYGRFHITCATVPDEDRGSNFILKLDERSLPTGYRLTTENPRVQRATRGKMIRFNFGATIHRVVRIDISDGVFEPDTAEMRSQWIPRIGLLIEELQKAPSILRLSYLGDIEREGLVQKRLKTLKKIVTKKWKQSGGDYRLVIETEIFWRRGAPLAGQ